MAPRRAPLTPSQALYVVDRLVAERRVSAALIERLRSEMASEIARLEERLAALRGRAKDVWATDASASTRQELSAATRASRRLQGQYLNLIRRVPANQRARFRRIAQSEGRERAITEMRKHLDAKRKA